MENPFAPNTASYKDFETLRDLEWHCTKCELESAQAKTWQVWRHQGLQLATNENGQFYKRVFCSTCGKVTVHRKLLSLEIIGDTKVRSGIPPKLAIRIKKLYQNEEAVLLRKLPPNLLEIDHRFPQVRWGQDEPENDVNMPVNEIRQKFILLSRSNNLLKSRYCERCVQTEKRGYFSGIRYWYTGDENWDKEISPYDERGCEGCFWYDPFQWRASLNELIENCS
ncbi:MAG: restriction endonuclease [Anaerolineales bacterium]|nr:restriction endonuclease [Anaerolineales bacterium]